MTGYLLVVGLLATSGFASGAGQQSAKVPDIANCQQTALPDECRREFLEYATHCDSNNENVIFSCNTGKNTVSVCASRTRTPTQGYVQYRFGPPGKPSFSFPQPAAHPSQFVRGGSLMYGAGSGTYMRLFSGKYAYVVYSGYAPGWEKAGVAVEKEGQLLANLPCVLSQHPKGILGESGLLTAFGIPEEKDRAQFVIP
jgi:hypothetical protein